MVLRAHRLPRWMARLTTRDFKSGTKQPTLQSKIASPSFGAAISLLPQACPAPMLLLFEVMAMFLVSSWMQAACDSGRPKSGWLALLFGFAAILFARRKSGSLARPENPADSARAPFAAAAPSLTTTSGFTHVRGRRAPLFQHQQHQNEYFHEFTSFRSASPPRRSRPSFLESAFRRHLPCAPRTPQAGRSVG